MLAEEEEDEEEVEEDLCEVPLTAIARRRRTKTQTWKIDGEMLKMLKEKKKKEK